ncbi:MAG: hypothetical protein WDN00_06100 [Limisphaerales bacterium]
MAKTLVKRGWIFNGIFILKRKATLKNAIQIMKNHVTIAGENALLGARPEPVWPKGMVEIVHAVQNDGRLLI